MKTKLVYVQLFGVLLLFLLMLLAVPRYKHRIPEELQHRLQKHFVTHGIDWVSIRVEGRDAILSGVAPTVEEHFRVVKLAQGVPGIRTVEDKISPMLIMPYRMTMQYDGQALTLTGYMPSQKSKADLLQKLERLYPSGVMDRIDIGSGEPREWNRFVETVGRELTKVKMASVNIVDQEMHISGKIVTEAEKASLESSLNAFNTTGYTLHTHLVALDEPAHICQQKFNEVLSRDNIRFQSGKSVLTSQNEDLLHALSDIASLCPSAKIEVIGHTDNKGTPAKNRALSLERAKVVVARLFGLGVRLERLSAMGAGERQPVAENTTEEGRAKNRRIEFRVIDN